LTVACEGGEHPTVLWRLWVALVPLAVSAFAVGAVGAAGVVPSQVKLTITVTVIGSGTVSGAGRHVSCAATACSESFAINPGIVRLKAVAWRTWKFTTWGHGCRGSTPTCSLRVRRSTRVTATFLRPGAKQNPIPIGQPATVREDWILKVVSVTPRADDLVLAASNNAPDAQVPPGKQDFMVLLSATYVGGTSGDLGNGLIGWVEVVGSRLVAYDPLLNGCPETWPSPSFQHARGQVVSTGEWYTGNVCYLIASTDADSLEMFVSPLYPPSTECSPTIWFALR
jgi:hypothetical protein